MMVQLIPQLKSHPGFADVQPAITMVTLYFRLPERPGDIKVFGVEDNKYRVYYYRQWKEELSETFFANDNTVIDVILNTLERLKSDPLISEKD